MLFAIEVFFLSGSNERPVCDDSGSGITVIFMHSPDVQTKEFLTNAADLICRQTLWKLLPISLRPDLAVYFSSYIFALIWKKCVD